MGHKARVVDAGPFGRGQYHPTAMPMGQYHPTMPRPMSSSALVADNADNDEEEESDPLASDTGEDTVSTPLATRFGLRSMYNKLQEGQDIGSSAGLTSASDEDAADLGLGDDAA